MIGMRAKKETRDEFREQVLPLQGVVNELLFPEENHTSTANFRLTTAELLTKLVKGEGVYWELERSPDGSITRILPYSRATVIANLYALAQKAKFTDAG